MHDVLMGPSGRGHQVPEPLSSIRGTWGDGLGPSIAAVMVLYWSFVGLHLALDGDVGRRLAWVDGLSGVAAGVALLLLLLLRPGHTGRLVLSVGLGTAAGANALAHVAVGQDLADTVLVVIVLLVFAAGFTSSAAAVGLVAALWLGWVVVTGGLPDDAARADHASDLAVATLAGAILHVGRRTTVQKLIRTQQELARLTEHDDLTGLANRRGFFAALRQALADAEDRQQRLVVLYCDVDGLKRVNDTRGHEAGDLLLVDVARRLRAEFPEARCVARLGGDEFGIVLLGGGAQTGSREATARAARVRDDTAEAVWSLSVGGASSDELHGPAPRTAVGTGVLAAHDLLGAVVGLADERMYQAKRLRPRPVRRADPVDV